MRVKHFPYIHKQTYTFRDKSPEYINWLLLVRIRDPPDGIKEVPGSCQGSETEKTKIHTNDPPSQHRLTEIVLAEEGSQ